MSVRYNEKIVFYVRQRTLPLSCSLQKNSTFYRSWGKVKAALRLLWVKAIRKAVSTWPGLIKLKLNQPNDDTNRKNTELAMLMPTKGFRTNGLNTGSTGVKQSYTTQPAKQNTHSSTGEGKGENRLHLCRQFFHVWKFLTPTLKKQIVKTTFETKQMWTTFWLEHVKEFKNLLTLTQLWL